MSWKKYSELTENQKFLVGRMYTNPDFENYLYDFDEKRFRGRKPYTELKVQIVDAIEQAVDEVEELIKHTEEVKPKTKRTRKK